jgi:hypothetical protein
MSISRLYINEQEIVTRQISGETLIVPIKGGIGDLNSIYTLNPPGTKIWELLAAGTTVGEIREAICGEYDVSEEEAVKDIEEFLDVLRTAGLICSSPVSGD